MLYIFSATTSNGVSIKELLFKNTGVHQTIAKNTFWLFLTQIISSLLQFALLIFAIRILGALEYGKFTFAFSFVSIIVIFADLGIMDASIKELAQSDDKEKEFSEFLTLNVILTAFALIIMLSGSFLVTSNHIIQKTIWVLSLFILITSFFRIFYSFLRSIEKMEYEAAVKVTQSIVIFFISVSALLYFKSALGLAYGYLFANLVMLVAFLLFFHFYFQPLKLGMAKHAFKLLKTSWPLLVSFTGTWLYISTIPVVLGSLNLIKESGWYGAANQLALAALLPTTLIVGSFYPAMSKFFISSKANFNKILNSLMIVMIFLAVPMLFGGVTLAPKIITAFYGAEFLPSIVILQALIFVTAINLINYPFSLALVVSNQQTKNFLIIFIGEIINIAVSIILIYHYGLLGAVVSIVISSLLALFLTIAVSEYSQHIIPSLFTMDLLKALMVSCFAGFLMYLVIRYPFIYNLNIFISVLIGCIMYSLVLHSSYKFVFHKNLLHFYR